MFTRQTPSPSERRVPCTSDAECITLFLQGDERCFAELVQRHHSDVSRYISSYIHNRQQCEDILQDVLVDFVLLLRSGNYTEQGKLRHLLINMAHKRINEFFRKQHACLALPEENDVQPQELFQEEEPEQLSHSEMLRLRLFIRAMKERRRAIFLQRYHGIPYEKISTKLGISPEAAKQEFSRTIKKLRKLFRNR